MNDKPSTNVGGEPKKEIKKAEIKKPELKGRKKGRSGTFNLILIIIIIAAIALFAWAEQQRRAARSELETTISELEELRRASEQSGQEVAQKVLDSLRAHMTIPDDPQPTVATIVNIEQLREANEFYSVADNGDHLIITEDRAILYDPDLDVILDVVPVQIDRTNTPTDGTPDPEATPTTETTTPGDVTDTTATDETSTTQ